MVGFLLLLTLGFFAPVLSGSHFSTLPGHQAAVYPWAGLPPNGTAFYPQSDQADLSHPWHTFLTRTLAAGTLPFWDPHSYGGGYPFFANGSSATLYAPRLLAALTLDPLRAHDLFVMLHVFLSGLLMYALMRELRLGRAGALLAAVSWMFAGFNMAWLHLEVVTPMSLFLPLNLLCVHRAHRTGSSNATIIAGLALGATLMSGHLVLLGLVYMVAVAYAGALAAGPIWGSIRLRQWRAGITQLLRPATIVLISLGVAMVVLLPTAYALSDSQRDPFGYDELVRSFLAPARVLSYAVIPPPLPVTAERMHEMTFAGTATGILAGVGFLARRPSLWLGRVMLIGAFAIAIRTPMTWLAYHLIPGFKIFRPYSRLLVFSAFALAALAGFGLDAVWRRARERPWGPASAIGQLSLLRTSRRVAVLSVLVVGGTASQLLLYGRALNPPFVPRDADVYFPRTPLIQALDRELHPPGEWPGRVLPTRVWHPPAAPGQPTLFAAEALLFGFDSAGGYDSAVPRRVTALVRTLTGEPPDSVLSHGLPAAYAPVFESPSVRFDLAERLGVTALATSPSIPLERTPTPGGALPPTELVYEGPDGRLLRIVGSSASPYLVYGEDVVPGPESAFRRFIDPTFDFRRSVVLESGELERLTETLPTPRSGRGRVLSGRRGTNTAEVTLTTSAPAWLVFHDSWAPGWSATVNGAPAAVLRANYAKRAVRVPAGTSEIRLRYLPPGLAAGAVATSITLLGSGLALAVSRRRKLRRLVAGRVQSLPCRARK